MALAPVVDAVDALPEAIRGEYKQVQDPSSPINGKYILDVTPDTARGFELTNTTALRNALGTERGARERFETDLRGYTALGKPEELGQRLARLTELEKIDPTKEADKLLGPKLEAALAEQKARLEAEFAPIKERATRFEGALKQSTGRDQALAAIAKHGGNAELLLPHIMAGIDVREDNGAFRAVVVDGSGNPRIGDGQGNLMTIEGLVLEFKGKHPAAFSGSGATGGGSTGSGGSPGAPASGLSRAAMTLDQRGAYIREKGMDAYLKLPA